MADAKVVARPGTRPGARSGTATTAASSPGPSRLAWQVSPVLQRHGLGLLLAAATCALLSWRVSRPALWLDESASAIATQRTWPNLWELLHSPDSPLVPYYALLKFLTAQSVQAYPQLDGRLEVLYRWPSVAAATLAVWLLTVWLARSCPPAMVLGTGTFLLATAGFSRYGQEARPYALVLLFTAGCTVLWARMAHETQLLRQYLWIALYGACLALLICANTMAAPLLVVHLVASVTAPDRGRRLWTLGGTFAGGAVGLAIVAPLAVVMIDQGEGATKYAALGPGSVTDALVRLYCIGPHRYYWVAALAPLVVLGMTRVFSPKYQFFARLATVWTLLAPAIWIGAIAARPNLLLGRYVLYVLPGTAILAGLGAVTLFEAAAWGYRRISGCAPTSWAPTGAGWAMTLVVLGSVVVAQLQSIQLLRMPAAHGDDIRPALALADATRYAHLPIFPNSRLGAIEISAYDRRDERRMIAMAGQRDQRFIWPVRLPADLRRFQLRAAPRLVLLMRASASADCGRTTVEQTAGVVYRCVPAILLRTGYRVERFDRASPTWTFAVLYRGGEPPVPGVDTPQVGTQP